MGSNRYNQETSSFLVLPAEIRNQVYEHVFRNWIIAIRPSFRRHDSVDADIYPATADPYQVIGKQIGCRINRPSNLLGLLHTCRQVYAETKLLPYSLNTFFYGERPFPRIWLDVLHEQLAKVRNLQLCTYMPANITLSRAWLEVLARFTSIRKVEVFCQLRMPSWGQEEDHLATATEDEAEMKQKIIKATSAACDVVFHRIVVSDWT